MLRLALILLPAAALLFSARPACAQEQQFATQTAAVAAAPSSENQPHLIVDGFVFAGQFEELEPACIKEVAVLKGAGSAVPAQRKYGFTDHGFVFITTALPLYVGGKLLRTSAEKQAAAQKAVHRQQAVRLMSATEASRYGLAPEARALVVVAQERR